MNIDFIIKNMPDIVNNQVKTALVKVAKDNNIQDPTEMDVLVRRETFGINERIMFMPHYKGKEVAKIPFLKIIDGGVGESLQTIILKVFKKQSLVLGINPAFINFIMKLQKGGVILVYTYHYGEYGHHMNVSEFLSL